MGSEETPHAPEPRYECIHCAHPVSSLYVKYNDPSNTSLSLCPRPGCGKLADVYQSHEFSIVLLDLLLLKPEVYRHLLRNTHGRKGWAAVNLGAWSVGVDAIVRCIATPSTTDEEALLMFAKTVGFCLIETVSLLLCIAASACLLRLPRQSNRPILSGFILIPLTFFYSSLPLVFTLLITSLIWRSEYLPSPTSSSSSTSSSPLVPLSTLLEHLHTQRPDSTTGGLAGWVASFSRAELKSGLAQVGRATGKSGF
ncbi:hypothetical protein JCM11641_001229 [Rhodosporidiobolus odoratus]